MPRLDAADTDTDANGNGLNAGMELETNADSEADSTTHLDGRRDGRRDGVAEYEKEADSDWEAAYEREVEAAYAPPDTAAQSLAGAGATPFVACTADPRFAFAMYIPAAHSFALGTPRLPLLVAVHGARRDTSAFGALHALCERRGLALLVPRFPAGHHYQALASAHGGVRFDEVLLAMLGQAGRTWRVATARVWLHGFSAGGQFAHRFLYVHARRLRGVAVGAPGGVTRVTGEGWPVGVGDVHRVFGLGEGVDWAAVRRVEVLVVVGERDTETGTIGRDEVAGRTRVERARFLHAALVGRGVGAVLEVVAGVGHDGARCLPAVEAWLAALL
ncbi:hypothetical protein B0H15DRAFT_272977 [Mycena belliarum]|uniref:Uncharacterized protein n=1 Tax=Mycena belliarum TaxID=1033014 RepID=A0AAD6U4R6_9AGAR|nr:hypothetical protein B0H15DRAFT_272977 [Mycena belliae]